MRRLLLFLLPISLLGCPNLDIDPDAGTLLVGPAGGIFIRNGAAIDVPRGAVDEDTPITITVIDTGLPEVSERTRISFGYRISPQSLTFKVPVKVILPWIPDRVPMAVDPGTFDSRRQTTTDNALQLPGAATLNDLKVVEAKTERLGTFWLTSPKDPNVDRLELTPEEKLLRVGETQQFTAQVIDPSGAVLPVDISWELRPVRLGSLDATGLFTAKAPGNGTITARAGAKVATAKVLVQGDAKGPLTFVHDTPFPTGNDLYGGAFAPGGLGTLFVGANGTVLAREGGGAFTRLFSSPALTLKRIAGTTASNAVAVGSAGNSGVLVEFLGSAAAPRVSLFPTAVPEALWFDGTHGMAVGNGNDVILKRPGAAWAKEYSPSFEPLLSVVGDGAGGFVTLGAQGSLYKYDPARKAWDSLFQTQLAVLLTAAEIVDAAGTEAWAVGGNKLWHFQSGAWSAQNLPAAPRLTRVTAFTRVDGKLVIAGAALRVGTILVFDPLAAQASDAGAEAPDGGPVEQGWSALSLRAPQVPRGAFSASPSGSEAYVVGDLGAVYRYEAGSFVELSRGFYGAVAAVSAVGADVFVGVNDCLDVQCSAVSGRVLRRAGPADYPLLGDLQPFGGAGILAIAAKSATEVTVATSNGPFRWNGTSWSALAGSGSSGTPWNALAHCEGSLHAVGRRGNYARGTPSTLTLQPPIGNADLTAFHCPTESELWTAGAGVLLSRSGTEAWKARTAMNITQADWRAVWSPAEGEGFAFGAAGYGVYFDTEVLQLVDSLGGIAPEVVNGLWGSTIDNLYAVGLVRQPLPFGFALRFDGAQWRLVDSGSQRQVNAISGASSTSIWLGTEGGGVLRGVAPP